MAYKINRSDEHIVLPDGNATVRDIKKYFKQMGGSEFYELEVAEVIECWLDEEDLPLVPNTDKPDWSKYGWILARLSVSNGGIDDTVSIRPLDSNIKEYPYPGEHVIVANYYGENYYTQKLNLNNSVNSNSFPGLSKSYNIWTNEIYKENLPNVIDENVRPLKSEEGDITFNGRFGNSIRLGSNVKEIKTEDGTKEDTGKENSANVIIRAGQGYTFPEEGYKPVVEDINLDGASMWMTTNQVVPLQQGSISRVPDLKPKKFDGRQIILNSDRIVFNSRGTDTFVYSNRDINLVSNNRIVLEGHKNVYLGTAPKQGETTGWVSDNSNIQPVLRGDQTMNLIDSLLDALIEFANGIAPSMGSIINFPVPIDSIIGPSMGLVGALQELKTRLDEPKSDIVKTN
jgi:hypothetical protein|tara:strand:- start:1346 stop:2545 length:1200 start_codon:yes stop_codon:yes gene_type:complete